jgi:serine/threonine kinase 16
MHTYDPPYAHNDLKPGNVLLIKRSNQPPKVVIMDFGSATPARKQVRSRAEALVVQV